MPYDFLWCDARFRVEQIAGGHLLGDLQVILLAAGATPGAEQRGSQPGVVALLKKPIRERELLAPMLAAQSQPSTKLQAGMPTIALPEMPASLRVLLAEDNVVNQRVGRRLIEKLGHFVVVVGDGRQAVFAMEEQDFDVVFMDVQMPVLDGIEATATIRQNERTSGTHQTIIAMTAHAMKGDRERCLAAGMDGYLAKPIRVDELAAVLASVVSPVARD